MIGPFVYLYAPSEHVASLALTGAPGWEQGFVVRLEDGGGSYYLFDDIDEYMTYYKSLSPDEKKYHEVIFGNTLQKLKIDVDTMLAALADLHITVEEMLENIGRAAIDAFYTIWGLDIDYSSLAICSSSLDDKVSYHIVVSPQHAVQSNRDAKYFTERMMSYLPLEYGRIIDVGVNKRTQNFRLVGNQKNGRFKKIISNHSDVEMIITATSDCTVLASVAPEDTAHADAHVAPPEPLAAAIVNACAGPAEAAGCRYSHTRGNRFYYVRFAPGHCDMCGRVHDSDNTFYAFYIENAGTAYRACWHDLGRRKILVYSDGPAAESGDANVRLQRALEPTPAVDTLFDSLPAGQKHVYDDQTLHKFELADTLCVKANMKMGKTKALSTLIDTHFSPAAITPVIRFVSFRQTFSANIKQRFPLFTLYSDVRGPLTEARLIVQVESLHRIPIRLGAEPPDLVILDECESIFEQFNSGLLRNFNASFAVFCWMVRYAKHLVCMDAGLCDRSYRILRRLRPSFDSRAFYHCNNYKPAAADHYEYTLVKYDWYAALYASIEAGEKIVVPINSLAEAKTLVQHIKSQYATKNVGFYSSETLRSERSEHFANVDYYWSVYDVLVYTPSITAGISYEAVHYDRLFGYFMDKSCNVETCMQMMGRVRSIKTRAYCIYLEGTANTMPVDIDSIRRYMQEQRADLYKNYDVSYLHHEYGPAGEVRYLDTDYLYVWLENVRIANLSTNAYVRRFVALVAATGAAGSILDGAEPNAADDISAAHAIIRNGIRVEAQDAIVDAAELDEEQAAAYQLAVVSEEDIDADMRAAYEKYKLRALYNFTGTITRDFVKTYNLPRIKRIYKNLVRILPHGSVDSALSAIRAEERYAHEYALALPEEYGHSDVHRHYVYSQHRFALALVKACGFAWIRDARFICRSDMIEFLAANEAAACDAVNKLLTEFRQRQFSCAELARARADPARYVTTFLKGINKVLRLMYDLSVVNAHNDPRVFRLRFTELFNDAEDGTRPVVPL